MCIRDSPQTGTLRGDLLQIGEACREQACAQAGTIRAVLVETSRHPALNEALQHQFLDQRKALMHEVLRDAADRGEIDPTVISDELWDLLPGYLIFRIVMPSSPPTRATVEALVDDVLIPSLARKTNG